MYVCEEDVHEERVKKKVERKRKAKRKRKEKRKREKRKRRENKNVLIQIKRQTNRQTDR